MSSVSLESSLSFHEIVHRVNDDDVEMSDGSVESEQRNITVPVQQRADLFEVTVKNYHDLFSQSDSEEYMRRVSVIMSFLSLMEIAPAKAFYLIKEASQDPGSQQFRDYVLFKQIFSDMQQLQKIVLAENNRKHTSSSNHQSVIGSSTQLDSLQWMFGFFTMYSIPFQYKNSNSGNVDEETILHVRERNANGVGDIAAVVLVQKPTLDSSETNIDAAITTILREFSSNEAKTRLGMIINSNTLTMFTIDSDVTHQARSKSVRSVSITKKNFDLSRIKDFAEIVTVLERYLALYLDIDSVLNRITRKSDANSEPEDDMESSPVPKSYPPFNERDHFYIDRFNTTLLYANIPSHYTDSFGSSPNDDQFCVKKRSHFCNWERQILNKLKTHPYIIKEVELDLPIQYDTTILFENVRPLNKRLFSLIPTDGTGQPMLLTQQLLNTRFEILRQFIKQALHSIVYCHNNGIAHNNVLSRGGTFFLDEQYKLKLMGFEHSVLSDDPQLRFRDMRHLAVVFAELMFNVQFDVSCDDDLSDWSAVWNDIRTHMDKHRDIVKRCPHMSVNDKLLYKINSKTCKHMYDLLEQMFHTDSTEYYHTYMYHSYIGMASSVYKEKSKQKLREKTVHMLQGSKNGNISPRSPTVDHQSLVEKWATLRSAPKQENSSFGSSRSDIITVQE